MDRAASRWLAFGLMASLAADAALGQGQGGFRPEEARERMVLPPGFQAQVFASEPEVRQPVAACFDERGRLWVLEYLQYPDPAGLKPVTVDVYRRTEYDRVPEPPPHGPRGADRVKVLEDTNGDGRADKVTIFVEGLNLASALAVGHGGVFIGQAPYLLYYPDKDRDDRPDGDPEVLLSGFGLQDAHATVNSMTWGPDGWLYGAQGSTVTARIRGVEFQQGIWRYHPRTKAFELFAEGGGNTWGLDFDRAGNAFGSSNGGFVAFHMVQGGYYWKGFAKHGPLHNPRTYGYFDSLFYEGAKAGGHVTPGGIIYEADQFPEAFRGAFIGGNLLANQVYWHDLGPRGSTFQARHGGTLIDSRDRWFRPIDLLTGPEGSLYVVDWYDKRASHLDPRDNWDKTNGRIYRISYGAPERVGAFDLSAKSSKELIAYRTAGNDWWPDMARRLLAERRDGSVIPELKALLEADTAETTALRDLWALHVCGGLDEPTALALLGHRLAGVRRWTVRLLGDEHRMSEALRAKLVELARSDPDVGVRSQLASSCQRWKAEDALAILGRLVARSEDARDPHVPLLIWWALEKQMQGDAGRVVEMLVSPEVQRLEFVRTTILERLARALASGGDPEGLAACARLITAAPGVEERTRLVVGTERGLEGQRGPKVPEALRQVIERLSRSGEPGLELVRLAVRLGDRGAIADALARVGDGKAPAEERAALLGLIGETRPSGALPVLLGLIRPKAAPSEVQQAALNALGAFDGPDVAVALIESFAGLPGATQDRVIDLLGTRTAWAGRLVEALERGTIRPDRLRASQATRIVQLGDPELKRRLEAVWGLVPGPGSEAKIKRVAEVRGFLVEGDKGNAARGHSVFKEHCAVCHKLFDEGESIGPDLTGAERGNLDFLLTSLVDPSALVRKEYQAQTVALGDGRVLTGLVVEESGTALTLVDSQRQKTVIAKAEIEEMTPSAISLMPEGVLDPLPEAQVRDLFRYLQSSRPPGPRP